MSNPFLLSAITKQERNAFTTFVLDSISNFGGWVDDVHMYSNIMTTIRFTIAENKILPFLEVLATKEATVQLVRGELNVLENADNSERIGSLQITFVHNDPDLNAMYPRFPDTKEYAAQQIHELTKGLCLKPSFAGKLEVIRAAG